MFAHYKTEGFVLKTINSGEADKIFIIYTKDFGKLEILGKSIRKIKSKLKGGVSLFSLSSIEFIQGKIYKTLTDAILINNFANIRKSLPRLKIAWGIYEVLDKLVKGEEADIQIWELLKEVFGKLNNPQFSILKCQIIFYYFLWNLLSILGYQPELFRCSFCQRKIKSGEIYFSPKEGGLICSNCLSKTNYSMKINAESVKLIRLLLKKDWHTLLRLKIKQEYFNSLKMVSDNYLAYILQQAI